MSKITDYFTGKGLPFLDLSNCAPSVDLTSSVLNGMNAQKGDKSCIVFNYDNSYPPPSIKLYNNAGTLVWTITPANVEATMDMFVGTGLYIPATDTLHIFAQKSTSIWNTVYCTINTLTGVITAGTKQNGLLSYSGAYSPHTTKYYLSGSTLLVVMSTSSVKDTLYANTTTRVLSNSSVNQIPTNKVLLMACDYATGGHFFRFLYDSTKLPFTTQGLSQVSFYTGYGSGFTLFGDYFFPIDAEGVNVPGPHLGYSKASFYKAVNSMLLQINPAKTIWEV